MNSRQRVTALSLLVVATIALFAAFWRPVAVRASSMTFARANHSATLLADGRLLAVGGSSATGAELYDSATNSWSLTGSMRFSRSNHAAVRLLDGRVLVVGGTPNSKAAEIYDPATGRWSLSAPMEEPRYEAAATLLADGRVLVVGGRYGEAANEIYDPVADSWSTISPNPAGPRQSQMTAVTLPDGRVVVAGGSGETANTLEIYDVAGDSWQVISVEAPLWTAQLAPLPDGRFLIISATPAPTALILDPATNLVVPTAAPPLHTNAETFIALPDGTILGTGTVYSPLYPVPQDARAIVYKPDVERWFSGGLLTSPRREHTATLLPNGRVLLAGGVLKDGRPTANAELYDPATSILDKQLFLPQVDRPHWSAYPTPGGWPFPTPTVVFVPTPTFALGPTTVRIYGITLRDPAFPNDSTEYVQVLNLGDPVNLADWRLSNASRPEVPAYVFPSYALNRDTTAVVFSQTGDDDLLFGDFFWDQDGDVWRPGDRAELRDSQGELISSLTVAAR